MNKKPILDAFRAILLSEDPNKYVWESRLAYCLMPIEEVMVRDISLNMHRWEHMPNDHRYIFETNDYWYSFWYEEDPFLGRFGVVQMRRFDINTNEQIAVWSAVRDIKRFMEKWPIHFRLPREEVIECSL